LIAIADINTLWRRKPFEELSRLLPVVGLAPCNFLTAWRAHPHQPPEVSAGYHECSIKLPPGWASRLHLWTAWRLWVKANQAAATVHSELSALVVTSPHYFSLVKRVRRQLEAAVVRAVTHSFFVSKVLAERAVRDYGVSSERVTVSPNATDEESLNPVPPCKLHAVFDAFPQLRRPIVGVVGGNQ
jgi:hypothetical protein